MKRRNFFRSLALLAGAASISPQIFIPKFEPVYWKPLRKGEWHHETGNFTFSEMDYCGRWTWIPFHANGLGLDYRVDAYGLTYPPTHPPKTIFWMTKHTEKPSITETTE